MVKVLFFAQLREQLGCDQLAVDAPCPLTVAALREQLVAAQPGWAGYLLSDKILSAVNQTLVKSSQLVQAGDEVAFFPPVTGG